MPVYPVPQFVHMFYIINMLEIASPSNSYLDVGTGMT